eukprot:TRINITY_DN651_c0_g1_i2.p1 TRINITY_DN651_c0_g1~~TRINITY_DN651_c0_g1_i2.p1  ORF type:complete len:303 (+),score=42.85 TRINITY_DN651_c0_g1_i2:232-1140(+)
MHEKLSLHVSKYRADNKQATIQLIYAFGQLVLGMVLLKYKFIPTVLFMIIEVLSVLHLFMIYHDMGHNSFFTNSKMNQCGEILISFFVWTPTDWSSKHKIHHGRSGDLSTGPANWNDTIYFTVEEYYGLPTWQRIIYRLFRDPLFFFTCVPFLNWCIKYRIPFLEALDPAQKNSTLHCVFNSLSNTLGSYMVVHVVGKIFGNEVFYAYLASVYLAAMLGILLFHLQHSYNPAYTVREDWTLKDSALKGSSMLSIPSFLKLWFMGIEYHHIHHYSTVVPGYFYVILHSSFTPPLTLPLNWSRG